MPSPSSPAISPLSSHALLRAGNDAGGAPAATICGFAGIPSAGSSARAVLAALAAGDGVSRLQDAPRAGRIAATGRRVAMHRAADATVVVAGHPRFEGRVVDGDEAAARVLARYRERGVRALDALGGDFALALLADEGREALLAVDRSGIGTLAYASAGDGIVFGSSVTLVEACRDAPTRIDLQSLFNYVFLHVVPGPATIFEGVRRVPPGGYVRVANGKVETGRYWRMRYAEARRADLGALKAEFRTLLEAAVRTRIEAGVTGAFLSGGTDSSTIAGMLARIGPQPARTYSIGFAEAGYDEVDYARIAARHFGTEHREYYVTADDVFALAPRVAAHCDQPFANASAVPAFYCADLARRDGVELLLGGDGGDELFGGNERYATQAMLGWYSRVPALARRALVEPLVFGLPGGDRLPLVRRARGYVTQARQSAPEQLHAYNMFRRMPADTVFTPAFLARIDRAEPLRLMAEVYDGADAATPLNRMLALDLQFTLADNDLYKVRSMCDLAGVDVAFPMLDDDLVAFSARLPSRLKLRGLALRWFFKQALSDFLPPAIIAKRKHGFGLPVGIWTKSHAGLRELAYDALRALGERGVVQPAFVERLIAQHGGDAPAYWGGQVWSLAHLELWLAQHGFAPSQPLV